MTQTFEVGIAYDAPAVTEATDSLKEVAKAGEQASAAMRKLWEVPQGAGGGAGGGGRDAADIAGDKVARKLADSTARSLANAFEDVVIEGKSLKQAANSLAAELQSSLVQGVTRSILQQALGGTGSAGGGWLGSLFSDLFGMIGFAQGGIMTAAGPLPLATYARGGVADTPQLALFGEGRRPEAFVPLPDGRRIPVQMEGQAAQPARPPIAIHVTVTAADAGSFRRSEGRIGAEIAAALQRHLRRNG